MTNQPWKAPTTEKLRTMDDDEIIRRRDALVNAPGGVHIGIRNYDEELTRRQLARSEARLYKGTIAITVVGILQIALLIWQVFAA